MGWSEQEGSAWIERGGDPSAVATPLKDASGGSEASELLTSILSVVISLQQNFLISLVSYFQNNAI